MKAARDLYSAARRDMEAGRVERAGEMARAAEAMTHVPEHLYQVARHAGRVLDGPPPLPRRAAACPRRKDSKPRASPRHPAVAWAFLRLCHPGER